MSLVIKNSIAKLCFSYSRLNDKLDIVYFEAKCIGPWLLIMRKKLVEDN